MSMKKGVKATSGALTKSSLTMKGLAIVFVVGIVAALFTIFLNNNVPQVQQVTAQRGFDLWKPSTWFS